MFNYFPAHAMRSVSSGYKRPTQKSETLIFHPHLLPASVCSLMKLFEGGILDKITNDEYEKMFQRSPVDVESDEKEANEQEGKVDTKLGERQSMNTKAKISSEKELTALNLRMLQGAFYLVLMGHILASLALILEIECRRAPRRYVRRLRLIMRATYRMTYRRVVRWLRNF